jgi:hypothetical protein
MVKLREVLLNIEESATYDLWMFICISCQVWVLLNDFNIIIHDTR